MKENSREIATVPLLSVARYFQLQGWTEITSNDGATTTLYQLRVHGDNVVEVVLPKTRSLSDADRLISDAIRTISQLDDKEPSSIVDDINSIGYDRIKTIIPTELVRFDSIELDMAHRFIENAKRLFTATATNELAPSPFFGRTTKEAQAYSERCRFGHTFRGSFGFTIESPVARNDEPSLPAFEQPAPFERRVIQRLARGLKNIEAAQRADDSTVLAREFSNGFNANMCDAFADLVAQTSDRLKFVFAWSPEWHPSPDLAQIESYSIDPATVPIVRDAAEKMRQSYISRVRTITGQVTRLKSEHNPADLLDLSSPREIVIEGNSDELTSIKVRVVLSPTDYILAVEAHKSGSLISITGLLERRKRGWSLSDPSFLSIRSST
jgi:hypothetical protein